MKLKDFRESYYLFSGKASDIARQLGFAGIAIIWAFRTADSSGSYVLAPELYWAGVLIVVGLFLDLFHYFQASIIWGTYANLKERKGVAAIAEIKAPRYLNWPGVTLWFLKIVSMLIAYIFLLRFLWRIIAQG